jgi:hypothetical protein
MRNKKPILFLAALAASLVPCTSAQARVHFGLHIGIPLFVPCCRPPVYVAPPPPPVYLVPPQPPVYVQPAPTVYQIPATQAAPRQAAGALVAAPQTPPPPLATGPGSY